MKKEMSVFVALLGLFGVLVPLHAHADSVPGYMKPFGIQLGVTAPKLYEDFRGKLRLSTKTDSGLYYDITPPKVHPIFDDYSVHVDDMNRVIEVNGSGLGGCGDKVKQLHSYFLSKYPLLKIDVREVDKKQSMENREDRNGEIYILRETYSKAGGYRDTHELDINGELRHPEFHRIYWLISPEGVQIRLVRPWDRSCMIYFYHKPLIAQQKAREIQNAGGDAF